MIHYLGALSCCIMKLKHQEHRKMYYDCDFTAKTFWVKVKTEQNVHREKAHLVES